MVQLQRLLAHAALGQGAVRVWEGGQFESHGVSFPFDRAQSGRAAHQPGQACPQAQRRPCRAHDAHSPVCGEIVRRHDPDRFFTSLFAPAAKRETLWTLYAFNHELAHARETVREPTMALIRLQWWREVVEGARRRHEVAGPLRDALDAGALREADLLVAIEGREAEPPQTQDEWSAFIDGTAGALAVAAGHVLGAKQVDGIRAAGAAYGAAGPAPQPGVRRKPPGPGLADLGRASLAGAAGAASRPALAAALPPCSPPATCAAVPRSASAAPVTSLPSCSPQAAATSDLLDAEQVEAPRRHVEIHAATEQRVAVPFVDRRAEQVAQRHPCPREPGEVRAGRSIAPGSTDSSPLRATGCRRPPPTRTRRTFPTSNSRPTPAPARAASRRRCATRDRGGVRASADRRRQWPGRQAQ